MPQKKKTQPRLTLHQLLLALSFWGSSVRILLIAFLAFSVFLARLMYHEGPIDTESYTLIYIVGSFALLDIGYVMLARAFPLRRKFDTLALLLVEIALGVCYIVPAYANVPVLGKMAVWSILIVILTLGIRALLGLLFSQSKR